MTLGLRSSTADDIELEGPSYKPGKICFFEDQRFPQQSVENPQNPEIRAATWNIADEKNSQMQIDELQNAELPDIVCLQEVSFNGKRNSAYQFAETLGYRYVVFVPAFIDKEDTGFGQAILSRYPIDEDQVSCIELPQFCDWSDQSRPATRHRQLQGFRGALKARIKIGNRTIVLYNAHLENLATPSQRFKQYEAILADTVNKEEPCLIAGDLNNAAERFGIFFDENFLHMSLVEKLRYLTKCGLFKVPNWHDHLRREYIKNLQGGFRARIKALFVDEFTLWEEALKKSHTKKSFIDGNSQPTYEIKFMGMPFYRGKLDHLCHEDGKFIKISDHVKRTTTSDHHIRSATFRLT